MSRLAHPRFGLDWAWGSISPSAHKAVGSSFGARYLSYDPGKNLSRAEADDLQGHGIDVVVVWETTASRASQGYDAGVQDAKEAARQAAVCGKPATRPIYFAVDFDTAGNPGTVDAYFDGVASVLSKALCGPYGGIEVVTHLLNRGFGYAWQTYAWSGGNLDTRAQLFQYSNGHLVGGTDCDFNHALYEDFGQWSFKHAKPGVDYSWFPPGKVLVAGKLLDERATVMEYDRLQPHKKLHAPTLHKLKEDMVLLRKRIWTVAHWDQTNPPIWGPTPQPTWGVNHRGWRWQELARRTK